MAQPVAKEELHRLIDTLPDEPTWEDVQYLVYVRAQVDEGRRSAREEPTVTTEELLAEYGLTLNE